MASNNELLHKATTGILVLVFVLTGVMKITPILSPEVHGQMVSKFVRYARVPPIDLLRLDPTIYRVIVAVTELGCAAALVLCNPRQQLLATYTLLVLMLGAIYTHLMAGDAMNEAIPAIFVLAVVLLRLYTLGKLPEIKIKTR